MDIYKNYVPLIFAAQNNCLINEHTAEELCREPEDPLPPLLEIAARAVIGYQLTWEPGSIPKHLDGKKSIRLVIFVPRRSYQ